jgi:hypothetical protein
MPKGEEEKKENKLWEVDPTIFDPRKPAGYFDKILTLVRTFGKYVSFGLLLLYAPILVVLGIVYGGLVFWGTLAGSMALIGLTLKKLGYAQNFAAWNPRLGRQLLAIFIGFLLAAGLFLGLFTFRVWLIPIAFGLTALGLVLSLRKRS